MNFAKILLFSGVLTCISFAVSAQLCVTRPSCVDMGYDMTEAECTGKRVLRCPFDFLAVFCEGEACPAMVTCVSPTICKTECRGKCVECGMPDRGEFFDGRGNTQKIIAQIGAEGLAATACNQFYPPEVSSDDSNFGAGKWYLPAMGELIKMYGLNLNNVTAGFGSTGADPSKGFTLISSALNSAKGAVLNEDYIYWSSCEYDYDDELAFAVYDGRRRSGFKSGIGNIRCFTLLENCINLSELSENIPQVGHIMYSDKTWSKSLNSSKKPIGVITDVYGTDVTVISLKDLTFSSRNTVNNFDASNPFGNSEHSLWSVNDIDITALTNYNSGDIVLNAIKAYQNW